MMSLRQKITSIEKFTSLGKLSAQLCLDAGFQIINGIQSYGDHVMDDGECAVKSQQPSKKGKRLDNRSTMVSTIKVSAYISLQYVQIVRKTVCDFRKKTTAKRLISIMIKMDTIWWNLHARLLCLGKTTTSYVDYEHNL